MKKFERLIIYSLFLIIKWKQIKNITLVVVYVLLASILITQAQDATWLKVSIPEICTFQIPPTVEIQKGTYTQINDQLRNMILEINISLDRVVAQPKGINDFDLAALKKYCRIIVETTRGAKGDYAKLDEPLLASETEMKEIDKELKNQSDQVAAMWDEKGVKMTILSWQSAKIISINRVDVLMWTYTRSMDNAPPVLVQMYIIQNNDLMHSIAISYRESEKDIWADDLGKVINTFKFKKR